MEIIRAVLRDGHDLVVKTGQEAGSPLSRLFGSDDLHLLRKCPCPVWIDRQRTESQYRCVLAAVAECAKSIGADIIVMGTVGRTGISGLFRGNTAQNVLQSTQLPVWAIKPAGFASPVTL